MGNRYTVKPKDRKPIKLTAMQNACYNYIMENNNSTIEDVITGVYGSAIRGERPDIWSYRQKLDNVTKYCDTLLHLGLITCNNEQQYSANPLIK